MISFDDIPVETFGEVIDRNVATRPDAVAIIYQDRVWSYAEIAQYAGRIATGLLRDGFGAGDRIAWLGRNTDVVPMLAIALARIGAIFVPINWRLSPREIAHILTDSGSRLLILSSGFEAPSNMPTILEADLVAETWLPPAAALTHRATEPTDTVLMIYTSGTTGMPKGVMLSHRSLFGTSTMRRHAAVPWDKWGPEDVTLVPIPLAHIGGFGMMARAFFFGARVIIQPTFDSGNVLTAIANQRVNKLALVPTAIKMVIDHPRARAIDYSRIETMVYGAAPITLTLLREAMSVFNCQFAQSYGMTEVGGTCVALPPDDHDVEGTPRMRAAGRALPGSELRVTDAAGLVLPAGALGEINIRSISMMNGYWGKPEATAAVLGADGWYRTGDAGVMDEHGYIFIKDRLKDMIVSGAENIYPAEVENALAEHPDVSQVAVIGIPDLHWGEAVKAIIVPVSGRVIDPDALMKWCKGRIAGYKVPRSVDVVDDLPRNATGKVQKEKLRQKYWQGAERRVN